MVHHVRIGDRQNHPRLCGSQPCIERVLQINHVGPAIRAVFGVHAMIGGEDDRGPQFVEPREIPVHHRVEIVGQRRAGRGLVLDVIGGGQVHEIRPLPLHQLHARDEDEFRKRRAVHGGQRHADAVEHIVDAVFGQCHLIGLFG